MALAVKLTCAVAGVNAETLEERIREGDEQAASLVRRCITNQFPTLAVCEDMLDLNEMSRYMREVTDAWGAKPELVIYDYLQLLPGFDAVPQQMSALKGWGKREDVPVVVLHQTSRSSGADGKKISIDSGAFGGEPLATFVIGVRRKKSEFLAKIEAIREQMESPNISSEKHERLVRVQLDLQDELTRHENTISVSLVKNKTPPSRLVDDLDFDLDADTGRMRARP
jgi:galactose-1-phosphate uridylyltransferase